MTNTNLQTNIGWLFYKDYYRYLYNNASQNFKNKNRKLFNTVFEKQIIEQTGNPEHQLKLTTSYPGLLIGSGYSHESGQKNEDELKIGFFFDYTSGLPVISGSSVKGVLRSVFPDKEKREEVKRGKIEYIRKLIYCIANKIDDYLDIDNEKFGESKYSKLDIIEFEKFIFEGKEKKGDKFVSVSIYKRDLFFDAVIHNSNVKEVKEGNKTIIEKKSIFRNDYITHHEHPLKDPNPVQFIKILPNVDFNFSFNLQKNVIDNITIDANTKLKLFEKILCQIGAGSKTNVGYGQFSIIQDEN